MKNLVLLFIATFNFVISQTIVSGDVSGEWTSDGNPYIVVEDLNIQAGTELIISEGVIVQFNVGGWGIVVYGSLIMNGSSDSQIYFQSISGGGTNAWRSIYLQGNSIVNLEYVNINNGDTAFTLSGCDSELIMNNVNVSDSYGSISGSICNGFLDIQNSNFESNFQLHISSSSNNHELNIRNSTLPGLNFEFPESQQANGIINIESNDISPVNNSSPIKFEGTIGGESIVNITNNFIQSYATFQYEIEFAEVVIGEGTIINISNNNFISNSSSIRLDLELGESGLFTLSNNFIKYNNDSNDDGIGIEMDIAHTSGENVGEGIQMNNNEIIGFDNAIYINMLDEVIEVYNIFNNSIINNSTGIYFNTNSLPWEIYSNLLVSITNNLFSHTQDYAIEYSDSGCSEMEDEITYNLFYMSVPNQCLYDADTDGFGVPSEDFQNLNGDESDINLNIYLDPLFVDYENGDYDLTEESPCIDAGNFLYPFDPDGTIPDIGAYYYDQNGGDDDIYGCTGFDSCNYNPEATIDDGSCIYSETNYDCYGNCTIAVDCAGECGGLAQYDCVGTCNGIAEVDNCGTCDADASNDCIQDCAGEWGGTAVEDAFGVCGGDGVLGCTYSEASNYNPDATVDDGSCEFMLGDFNQDGILNILDIVQIVNAILDAF